MNRGFFALNGARLSTNNTYPLLPVAFLDRESIILVHYPTGGQAKI